MAEAMAVGTTNVQVLAALDGAHTAAFGAPTPTSVNHSPVAGKAILISGHDLVDLKDLLEQTKGTGINVYTHGEVRRRTPHVLTLFPSLFLSVIKRIYHLITDRHL